MGAATNPRPQGGCKERSALGGAISPPLSTKLAEQTENPNNTQNNSPLQPTMERSQNRQDEPYAAGPTGAVEGKQEERDGRACVAER